MDHSRTTAIDMNKAEFKTRERDLRTQLLDAQFDVRAARSRAVLILLNGPDGSGKGAVLNRLFEWLDPRGVRALAYDIEREIGAYPPAWRYWRDLPPRGRIGVVLGSWYHFLLLRRATEQIDEQQFRTGLENINRWEAMMHRDGVLLLKIWLQLSPETAQQRYNEKKRQRGPMRRPLVREWGEIDTKKERARLVEAARLMGEATHRSRMPWHLVPADDSNRRDIAVGELLLSVLRSAESTQVRGTTSQPATRFSAAPSILAQLDLSRSLDKREARKRLQEAQERLYDLSRCRAFKGRALVCVFEGQDAAGKGGAIRRLRAALDPRQATVYPIGAPTEEERARPYLWRFWRRLPPRGAISVFDRSWYGRVLVERVEGLAREDEWQLAYDEINDFERQLHNDGYIIHKFWLAIDADEQLRRFEARKDTPHKRFKITDEDWRNRAKWDAYRAAVDDMLALTSPSSAPWTVVESNDKRFARVKVVETLVTRLESEL